MECEKDKVIHYEKRINELKKEIADNNAAYQRRLNELKNQCNEYAMVASIHCESIRYRLGSIICDSIKDPRQIITMPRKLLRLYREYRNKEKREVPILKEFSSNEENIISQNNSFDVHNVLQEYDEFYKYSSLIPKIFLDNKDRYDNITLYMDMYKVISKNIYCMCKQDILVTIIMPVYNRANIVSDAINSVLAQTYKNWELIVVDDFSTDDIKRVIEEFDDERIRLLKNCNEKGVSGARNTGLKYSNGDYIAYLDSDNDWDQDYLLLMVNTLRNHTEFNSIYCAQYVYKFYDDNIKQLMFLRFGAYNHSLIKNRNYIDLNCYIHKKILFNNFGGFSQKINRFVDWELIHRYASSGSPFAFPCVLSNYYFDKDDMQITSTKASEFRNKISLLDKEIIGSYLNLSSTKYLDINDYRMYSDKIKEIYDSGRRKVSIIIPSYEAIYCLVACIEAVHKFTTNMDYEIIVVDNNSSETVREYLRKLSASDSKVRVILNDHNMGFTYAVNQGIAVCMDGSDIVLLNNDAIVTEGWIEEMYRVKDLVSEKSIIVPRQVLLPNTKTMNTHIPECLLNRELDVNVSFHHRNIKDVEKYALEGFVELTFAPFFLVMITRECYKELGLLDEKNGRHYKSDRLYCKKALENGIDIIYTPYSKAYHLLQQSTSELKEKDREMFKTIFIKNDWSDLEDNKVKV